MTLPITGALLGCAVGDAIGLPYEGLTKQRGVRLLGAPDHYRFVFGRGTVSDDTEHTCLVAQALCESPTDPDLFDRKLGCRRGVTGYVYRTVPVAIHCWLSHPRDYRLAVRTIVECGGDTDTTAAIVGAIVGSVVGRAGIPEEWISGIWEWPHSVAWMEQLADAVSTAVQNGTPVKPPQTFFGARLARNGVFTGIVIKHAARRLLPSY